MHSSHEYKCTSYKYTNTQLISLSLYISNKNHYDGMVCICMCVLVSDYVCNQLCM